MAVDTDLLGANLGRELAKIKSRYFVEESKLTLVMRVPTNLDCYLVLTDDDLEGVIEAIKKSETRVDDGHVESRAP